jgi:hypothetical protein
MPHSVLNIIFVISRCRLCLGKQNAKDYFPIVRTTPHHREALIPILRFFGAFGGALVVGTAPTSRSTGDILPIDLNNLFTNAFHFFLDTQVLSFFSSSLTILY